MSAQRNTNPEVTMFTIKANRSTVHIAGIEERTPAQHDSEEAASARGYVAYYAESACGGLTRSGHRMETLGEYADIEAALNAAEVATYSISGRKVCKTRSEERRVGKECVSTCRSRASPSHSKKINQ